MSITIVTGQTLSDCILQVTLIGHFQPNKLTHVMSPLNRPCVSLQGESDVGCVSKTDCWFDSQVSIWNRNKGRSFSIRYTGCSFLKNKRQVIFMVEGKLKTIRKVKLWGGTFLVAFNIWSFYLGKNRPLPGRRLSHGTKVTHKVYVLTGPCW